MNVQLRRVSEDGQEDESFITPSLAYRQQYSIDSSNRIIFLARGQTSTQTVLGRLTPTGELDSEFQTNVVFTGDAVIPDPLILPDGSIIVAAVRSSVTPPSYRLNFERVEANGDVTTFSNTTFIATSGLRPQCNVLVLSPDGLAFYSAGVFRTMHGFSVTNFAKMSIDGTLDTNFVAQISGSAGVSHLAFQSNGKILLAGAMGPNPAGGVRNVLRLNPDGSVDGEFQVPSFERLISTVSIKDFFVDRFDRLLVAGNFFTVNGQGLSF